MLSSSRLICFVRIPCRMEHTSYRFFINVNTSRFLCNEPSWRRVPREQNPLDFSRRSGLLNQTILERNCSFALKSHYLSFSNQVKDGKAADFKADASKPKSQEDIDDLDQFQKLSLYEKLKAMYRDYWYILVPVHLSTSVVFFGLFYYAVSSGVDIIAILERLHFSEKIINSLKDSSAGYIAISYALYKIFTPIRYTVTLGGTTWAIRFLTARGTIPPVKEAKKKMQNIISAIKLPEQERQKFLEEKGMQSIGKAVSSIAKKSKKEK